MEPLTSGAQWCFTCSHVRGVGWHVLTNGVIAIIPIRIQSDRVVDRVVNGAAAGVRELIAFFHQQDCNIKVLCP